MTPSDLATHPNPDLQVGPDQRPRWNSAPHRRHGFHTLHRLTRYAQGYRAARVLDLRLSADLSIAQREDVRRHTASPWFSAMVVARGNRILFETYAPDFAADSPHSIMSISKMSMNLIIGRLHAEGRLALEEEVGAILPWIGPGYAHARLQDVLNMNVLNAYSEDYSDPNTSAFLQEVSCGMRLPPEGVAEPATKDFLAGIGLAPGRTDCANPTGSCLYRSANTDVLACVAEVRGGRAMGLWLADLADAAGVEGVLHMACDRSGFPAFNGGICLTARDLARYGLIFARGGIGVDGRAIGSTAFLQETRTGGIPLLPPRQHLRYSNQTNTNGRWIGHGGYGGQYLVADPETGTVALLLSVLQDEAGYDAAWYPPVIEMLADICTGSA